MFDIKTAHNPNIYARRRSPPPHFRLFVSFCSKETEIMLVKMSYDFRCAVIHYHRQLYAPLEDLLFAFFLLHILNDIKTLAERIKNQIFALNLFLFIIQQSEM